MGSKALAVAQLRELGASGSPISCVAVLDDRDDERSAFAELHAVAQELGVPVSVVHDHRDLTGLVERHEPLLAFVCGWYRILPDSLLRRVPLGWLGVHASALPRYRGFAPVVWAILNGEPEIGVSLFQITPGLDEGDLYDQRMIAVGPDDDVAQVLEQVAAVSSAMVRERLPEVLDGRATPYPQPAHEPSYCAARRPEDGRLPWAEPARRLHDRVRAQTRPYPGAFSRLDGRRVTVWRSAVSAITAWGEPGSVVRIGRDGVDVACGGGTTLTLVELQVEGEPPRSSGDVVTSVRARFGTG